MIKDELDLSYSEMSKLDTYADRLNYLSLCKKGYRSPRDVSNKFYHNPLWLQLRDEIIARDGGYDLGIPGIEIDGPIYVHHVIPIEPEDLEDWNEDILLNPDNLVCCSHKTHMEIHYGLDPTEPIVPVERHPGDTKLW